MLNFVLDKHWSKPLCYESERASVEENERDENDDMPEEDCSVRARS